jgi:hypothetical protein
MGKWRKHPPRKRSKFSRWNFPSDSAWRYVLLHRQEVVAQQALGFLRSVGFKIYLNTENGRFAVSCLGYMFEFRDITSPKAQEFATWVSAQEGGITSALPANIERIRLSKDERQREGRCTSPRFPEVTAPTTDAEMWWMRFRTLRAGTGRGGFWDSTVPGHYALLNWFDLCTG